MVFRIDVRVLSRTIFFFLGGGIFSITVLAGHVRRDHSKFSCMYCIYVAGFLQDSDHGANSKRIEGGRYVGTWYCRGIHQYMPQHSRYSWIGSHL